jgi:divinyl protochlorophyllide a 8-vinyl-reductase
MPAARIGPNAVTRVAEAMRALVGDASTEGLFVRAGLDEYLRHPPESMVDEEAVARLHRELHEMLDADGAQRVCRSAGQRTGDYLLARRIPQPVQWLLRCLPAALASRLLLKAIGKHAWTFAGSGRFRALAGRPVRLEIIDNPLCRGASASRPICDYYAATFEQLFRRLVHADAVVVEVACEAMGAPACVFEIRW